MAQFCHLCAYWHIKLPPRCLIKAIHLEATLNLFVKMPSVRPLSSSLLPPFPAFLPASSVHSPRRCTLRSGPTRSHAAPTITICEAQHPRHASIWKPCPTARALGLQAKHEHTVLTQTAILTKRLRVASRWMAEREGGERGRRERNIQDGGAFLEHKRNSSKAR